MNADEILKALFPHEETIKRLQAENEELRAKIAELTKPAEEPKEKKRGGDTRKES
jgi:hypothetical protein